MTTPTNTPTSPMDEVGTQIELIIDHAEQAAIDDKGMFSDMDNNPMNRQTIFNDVMQLITSREQVIKKEARKNIEERERSYLESVMRSRAKTNPDMTIKEFYEGQFNQKMTLTGQNSATFHSPTQLKGDNNE